MTGISLRSLFVLAVTVGLLCLGGCSSSHGRGEGPPCGPTTCALDQVCCNASCGVCTAPGAGCTTLECSADAGPILDAGVDAAPPLVCGGTACGLGESCCAACPGDPDFCSGPGGICPAFDCPPVGCEACRFGEACCDACPGDDPICVGADEMCPVLLCPPDPPGCSDCGDSICCPGCGGEAFCADSGVTVCPDLGCPMPVCETDAECGEGLYCARLGCDIVGTCASRPTACTDDCPGVCGCDGENYCNACVAAAAGVTVAHESFCAPGPSVCEGRDYCTCDGECAPLIDLTTGCVCDCDEPFSCGGPDCDCDCGGAVYLGCAPAGRCAETEITCEVGCTAFVNDAGCPSCICVAPG